MNPIKKARPIWTGLFSDSDNSVYYFKMNLEVPNNFNPLS